MPKGQVLDFRLSEEEFGHRIQDRSIMLFSFNLKSAIENLKSLDDFVRSHEHVPRNRQANLLGRFEIEDELDI